MEKIIFRVIIFTSACCLSSKHIFHKGDKMTMSWGDARQHCRTFHNDLSRLSSELEEELFIKSVDNNDDEGWIGIYWDKDLDIPVFKWSGGDPVTYYKDLKSQDFHDASKQSDNVYWNKKQWQWEDGEHEHHFFCFSLTVVQEEKSWEEALEHCANNHRNLSSLLSETDNLLATNEMNHTDSTERVWIGLRYLGDGWLWVNGDPLVYKNWTQEGQEDLQCPLKRRCGALTKEGEWESWDCQEKLNFLCG